MGQALYRTHRPKKLSEIVGQEHVTVALDRALKKGLISHAYLLTGPRGTGKTSIARILAHEINNLPYNEDRPHLDIIEIDAASNRRIEEIRDLREKVHTAPTSAKYKVYIIDEVHMLTKEAFNALLKTLEEPPAHVVFILATTETHKLPATIISRTQRFTFKPVEQPKVIAHLRHIADKEKIKIDDEALALIAAHGEGSFRDSISLLDQIRGSDKQITLADVQTILGIAPAKHIAAILVAVQAHDALAATQSLSDIHEQGYEPVQIAKQLGAALRDSLLNGTAGLQHDTLMQLLAHLVQVPTSPNPATSLEIAILDAALQGTPASTASAQHQESQPEPQPKPKVMPEKIKTDSVSQASAITRHKKIEERTIKTKEKEAPTEPEETKQDAPQSTAMLDTDSWTLILQSLKQKHNTLFSIIKGGVTTFEPGKINLSLGKKFYVQRINDLQNKESILAVISEVTGNNLQLVCTLDETIVKAPALPEPKEISHTVTSKVEEKPAPPEAISNIFAGAELLES